MSFFSSLKKVNKILAATALFSLAPLSFASLSCSKPERLGEIPYCQQHPCDEDKDGYCRQLTETAWKDPSVQEACPASFAKVFPAFDCNDTNKNIFPNATEYCNGYDDNCNGQTDESDLQLGQSCGLEAALDGIGECTAGVYVCLEGRLNCSGTISPQVEICDGEDNDCNNIVDDYLNSAECYYEWTNVHGELVKNEPDEETKERTKNVGPCRLGYEITYCADAALTSDGVCHNAVVPKPELCGNGIDDDCNGIVDDGTCLEVEVSIHPIDVVVVMDCAMEETVARAVRDALSNAVIPGCELSSEADIRFSTVYYTTDGPDAYIEGGIHYWQFMWPKIMRAQVSVEEFQNNFAADVSGPCHPPDYNPIYGFEQYSLDPLFFAGCVLDTADAYEICSIYHNPVLLDNFYARNPGQEFWREDSEKYIILFADQRSESYGLYNWVMPDPEQEDLIWVQSINQADIADLLHGFSITVDTHTPEEYHNLQIFSDENRLDPLQREAGYGWLDRDTEGHTISGLFNLVQEVYEGTLQATFEQRVHTWHCE